MTVFAPARLTILAVSLWLAGCGGVSPPYIPNADPAIRRPQANAFLVRYSWGQTLDDVIPVIAEKCGEEYDVAGIVRRPYQGTALHPHELRVRCGSEDTRTRLPWQRPEEMELVQLR